MKKFFKSLVSFIFAISLVTLNDTKLDSCSNININKNTLKPGSDNYYWLSTAATN